MIKSQHKYGILVIFILLALVFNILLTPLNHKQVSNQKYNNYDEEESLPKIAAALTYSDIFQNATDVYRWFESINFTVDTTNFPNANYTIMQISFFNGSIRNYDMASVGNNKSFYEYKPGYYAPLGFQNVSFLIYNQTGTLLNDQTTYTNFTIHTNCLAIFKKEGIVSYEYFIGDILYAELLIDNNFTSNSVTYELQWDITVVDSRNETTQNNLINLGSNSSQFTLPIINETFRQVNKEYYIKVNMSDINTGKKVAAYFPFYVRNSNPLITSIIDLSPSEVFRSDDCTISVNATDIESLPENLTVLMNLQDSEGKNVLVNNILEHDSGHSYSDLFTLPSNRPIGSYKVIVIARDEHGGESSKETFLTVKNNLPEIHSYTINGMTMDQSISVQYGVNLVFSFNVSDVEGVSYVKLALIDEKNDWYNITSVYNGVNTEIVIRTIELITGTWYVYVYVIDSDGAVTSLTKDYNLAPQGIRIIPDILSNFMPWIGFFFGLGIGILVGIGSIYKYFKSKAQATPPSKKEILTKKKPIKKKAKAKLIKEEPEKKEIEEIEPPKEEKEEFPKRKIKRKL